MSPFSGSSFTTRRSGLPGLAKLGILAVLVFLAANIALYVGSWAAIYSTAQDIVHNTALAVILAFILAETLAAAIAGAAVLALLFVVALVGGIGYLLFGGRRRRR